MGQAVGRFCHADLKGAGGKPFGEYPSTLASIFYSVIIAQVQIWSTNCGLNLT